MYTYVGNTGVFAKLVPLPFQFDKVPGFSVRRKNKRDAVRSFFCVAVEALEARRASGLRRRLCRFW